MTRGGSRLSWLPEALEPVALRIARVDDCIYRIGDAASEWSLAGPLDFEQQRCGDKVTTVVTRIRPIPPIISMLFSEAINHLRAAVDNAVWHLATVDHPGRVRAANLIAMPIVADEKAFDGWAAKRAAAGLTAFGEGSKLLSRIHSLQPFVDKTVGVPSVGDDLARLMSAKAERAHPLLLAQRYSNDDKHRAIRTAVSQSTATTPDEPFWGQDRSLREWRVGDVVARTTWRHPVAVDTNTAAVVIRPEPFKAAVSPVAELTGIRDYVANIAVPTLVLGMAMSVGLPPQIDLSDNNQSNRERLDNAGWVAAKERLNEVIATRYVEAMSRPVQLPPVVDMPDGYR